MKLPSSLNRLTFRLTEIGSETKQVRANNNFSDKLEELGYAGMRHTHRLLNFESDVTKYNTLF